MADRQHAEQEQPAAPDPFTEDVAEELRPFTATATVRDYRDRIAANA